MDQEFSDTSNNISTRYLGDRILANGGLCMQNFRLKASHDTEKMSSSSGGPGPLRTRCDDRDLAGATVTEGNANRYPSGPSGDRWDPPPPATNQVLPNCPADIFSVLNDVFGRKICIQCLSLAKTRPAIHTHCRRSCDQVWRHGDDGGFGFARNKRRESTVVVFFSTHRSRAQLGRWCSTSREQRTHACSGLANMGLRNGAPNSYNARRRRCCALSRFEHGPQRIRLVKTTFILYSDHKRQCRAARA